MSHFTTLVLLTETEYKQDCMGALEKLLAPYNERIDVPEYDHVCGCAERAIYRAADDHAKAKTGRDIQSYRDEFWPRPEGETEEQETAVWKELTRPYFEARDAYVELHRTTMQPQSDCSTCEGTGFYTSTYNPLSKWDWWVIGGRWDGDLADWRFTQQDTNAALARDLVGNYTPFAILTPNGKWNERGEMHWFAITTNENENWDAIAAELLTQYGQHIAVLCDLHI